MNGVGVAIVKNLIMTFLLAAFGWVHNGLTTLKTKVALLEEQKQEMKMELKEMKETTENNKQYLRSIIEKHEDDPNLHHAIANDLKRLEVKIATIESKIK